MDHEQETEKRFEEFIETYLVSEDGGWTKATDAGYCSDEKAKICFWTSSLCPIS